MNRGYTKSTRTPSKMDTKITMTQYWTMGRFANHMAEFNENVDEMFSNQDKRIDERFSKLYKRMDEGMNQLSEELGNLKQSLILMVKNNQPAPPISTSQPKVTTTMTPTHVDATATTTPQKASGYKYPHLWTPGTIARQTVARRPVTPATDVTDNEDTHHQGQVDNKDPHHQGQKDSKGSRELRGHIVDTNTLHDLPLTNEIKLHEMLHVNLPSLKSARIPQALSCNNVYKQQIEKEKALRELRNVTRPYHYTHNISTNAKYIDHYQQDTNANAKSINYCNHNISACAKVEQVTHLSIPNENNEHITLVVQRQGIGDSLNHALHNKDPMYDKKRDTSQMHQPDVITEVSDKKHGDNDNTINEPRDIIIMIIYLTLGKICLILGWQTFKITC